MALRVSRHGALILLGFLLALFASSVRAQEQPTPKEMIDGWDKTAGQAERALEAEAGLATTRLEAMRTVLIDQRGAALELRDELERRVKPLREQLAALGPAPENGVAADKEVEARRAQLQTQIADLDARLKEVGLVVSRAATLEERLARRQRQQFTQLLFTRGQGPFDRAAWRDLAVDAPRLSQKVAGFLGASISAFDPFGAHVLITLALCLGGVVAILTWRSALQVASSVAQLASRQNSPGRKALFTGLEFVLRAGPAPLVVLFLVFVTIKVASPGETGVFVLRRLAETAAILSALAVLSYLALRGRAFQAPFAQTTSQRNAWMIFGVSGLAIVFALDWLALDFLEQAGAALGTLAIANGLVATLAAASLVAIAFGLRDNVPEAEANFQPMLTGLEEDDQPPADLGLRGAVIATLRTLLVCAALVLIFAAVSGYYALSRYVLTGVTLTGLLAGAATVLFFAFTGTTANAEAISASAEERIGSGAPNGARRPGQIKPIHTLVGLALVVAALPLLALSWGASSADISSAILFLFSDLDVGGVVISIQDIFWAVLVLLLGVWATRLLQRFLRVAVLQGAGLAPGARAAIDAGVGYVGVLLTLLLAISAAGVNLSNLAIIAGALSVGIGFGLQNVVSNFVAGLILLIERPIQPGDWIEVGGFSGNVKRINVRSTEIMTFDRSSVIVPNSELIAASVVNWTHRSLVGRAIVRVGVGYDSDPEHVARVLTETALTHESVLKNPPPWIYFADFGASSLDFEVRCYLRDITVKLSVESDLRYAILKRLREEGVEIPFPQRVVEMKKSPGDAGSVD